MKKLISKEWPLGHLLNPETPYSKHTDVRRTFARIRSQQARNERERQEKVRKLKVGT